jgi:hypothetical protein
VARALVPFRYHRAGYHRALAPALHRVRAVQRRVAILAGGLLAYLVATAGCYNPELRDCTVQCSAATDCTGGQVCRADGWCAMPGTEECAEGGSDNNVAIDAPNMVGPDAPAGPTACDQGCTNGTCVAGVCVIDCSAPYSCITNDVLCTPGLPCRVVCGDHSCSHKIVCGTATSCEVQCNGDFSCQDEIQCNTNRCDVDCIGVSSCRRRTRCANACACDASCTGASTCPEISECPASSCRLGNGCTSILTGCDSC